MKIRPAKTLILLGLIMFIVLVVVYRKINDANALSKGFVQTTWSGGVDQNATTNETYLTTWDKYYSMDSSITATIAGELRLKLIVTQP